MGLGAGEVVQGGTETRLLHHAQIHLQPALQPDTGAGGALGQHQRHFVVTDKPIHDRCGISGGDQQIDVADGFLAAAVAAGDDGMLHARNSREEFAQRFGVLGGDRQLEALLRCRLHPQRIENGGFGFLAEPRQLADAAGARGARQFIRIADVQLLVECADALRSQPRDLQEFRDRRRQLPAQPVQRPAVTARDDLGDLGGQVFADSGQLGEVIALCHHVRRRHAER